MAAKRVLVTGGCGFIPSNLIRHLLTQTPYEVVNVDALTYAGNPDNLPLSESDLLSYLVTGEPAVGLDNTGSQVTALGVRTVGNLLVNALPRNVLDYVEIQTAAPGSDPTVTTSPERMEHLVAACGALSGGSRLFLFTGQESLGRGDILAHEWVNGRGEVVRLLRS